MLNMTIEEASKDIRTVDKLTKLAASLTDAAVELSAMHSKKTLAKIDHKSNQTCQNYIYDLASVYHKEIIKVNFEDYAFIPNTIIVATKAYIKKYGYRTWSREAKLYHALCQTATQEAIYEVIPNFVSLTNRIANLIATRPNVTEGR